MLLKERKPQLEMHTAFFLLRTPVYLSTAKEHLEA